MSTEIARRGESTSVAVAQTAWDEQMKEVIRATLCPEADDAELVLFEATLRRLGLDAFAKQAYLVKRWNPAAGRKVAQVQIGIDGMRLVAHRTGKYRGQRGPFWCGPDGRWVEVWLAPEPPAAAKVEVLHKDFPEPLAAVATWDQYVQKDKNGKVTAMWGKFGPLMLGKCAESLALRKAFPAELSGVLTSEEMGQADNPPMPAPRPTQAQIPAGTDMTARVPLHAHRAQQLLGMGEREVVIGAMQEAGITSQQLADDETWERAQAAVRAAVLFPPVEGEVVDEGRDPGAPGYGNEAEA